MLRIFFSLALTFGAMVSAEETGESAEEPNGVITLEQAIAAALSSSPDLATYPWDLRVADARIAQARLRPNPEISIEAENVRLGGGNPTSETSRAVGLGPDGLLGGFEQVSESGSGVFSEAEFTLSLAQTFELGGKRAARILAAEKEREVASWDYEVARAEVAGKVVVDFVGVLAVQARRDEHKSLLNLSVEFAATVRSLVEAGGVSPLEGRRADAEVEQVRVEYEELMRLAGLARDHLAANWGASRALFTDAIGDVTTTEPLPDLQSLSERRVSHPMLKRWGAELASRDAILEVERRNRVPDLTLRVGYRGASLDEPSSRGLSVGQEGIVGSRTSGSGSGWEDSIVLEASIPLPIFHRNQGAISEAEMLVGRAGDEQRAWEKSLESALSLQHGAAFVALEKITGLATRVLPEIEATFALTREGYERGKFDFLRVLDAQRAVIDVRLQILDAQLDYHLARANMEQLLGASIMITNELPSN